MKTISKKSMAKGVKSMTAKAMTWSQVCKQISGIGGYVDMDGEKVRPLYLMQRLGVHVAKNSYKPADIFGAWSARLMGADDMVQIVKNVPVKVEINGETYRLYVDKGGEKKGVSMLEKCRLVSASDKAKDSTDVVVNAQNVLRGLYQSAYIDSTLAEMVKSEAKVAALTTAWVNAGSKDMPVWCEVAKYDGAWDLKRTEVKAEVKVSVTKKGTKGAKKAAKVA